MSNLALTDKLDAKAIEAALIQGDLAKLTTEQRLVHYKNVCDSLKLNHLTKPFDYISLNGKLTLYAKRDCTDQLRKIHNVSITITAREKIDDLYIVTARARDASGREDESTGAVNVAGLKGEQLANAFLKSETKAKRRVTLSICGLGLLDETEVESIKQSERTEKSNSLNEKLVSESATEHAPPLLDEPEAFDDLEPSLGQYVRKTGKAKGKKLDDLSENQISGFLNLVDEMKKKNEKIHPDVLADADAMRAYVNSLEIS